jgi:hypothetical protein
LRFEVLFAEAEENGNPSHALGLLGAYRKRPRSRRTAEKSDELAPLHVPPVRTTPIEG